MSTRKSKVLGEKPKFNPYSGLTLDLDITALNILCSFAFSENKNIKRSDLINLKDLISKTDIETSAGRDPNKLNKLKFIKRSLEARLEKGYEYKSVILSYINSGIGNDSVIPESNFPDLNDKEIEWVNGFIREKLKNYNLEKGIDSLMETCNNFKVANYNEKDSAANILISSMNNLLSSVRRSSKTDINNETFSLAHGSFEKSIETVCTTILDPGNKLRTGMKGLNRMLAGGFESGRVYCFFGLPGEGKSNLLLNLLYQLKLYNKNYKVKDKSKTPCVVLLTMENSESETIARLINARTGIDINYNTNISELIKRLRTEGGLEINESNPIDIIVRFVPGYSVSTEYLYTLYDELLLDGYEPICIIQDYIKRIRSIDVASRDDLRKELGNVVNEMKTFAQDKGIAVITASQFNRGGITHIDESRKNKNINNINQLGRGDIGESMLILENLDAAIYIVPETSSDETKKYMGFDLKKKRYYGGDIDVFFQPFKIKDGIALDEDEDTPYEKFKLSLAPNLNNNTQYKNSVPIGDSYKATNMNNEVPKSSPKTDIDETDASFQSISSSIPIVEDKSLQGVVMPNIQSIAQPVKKLEDLITWKTPEDKNKWKK